MNTSKKPAKSASRGKFKDLRAKMNPKGGLQKEANLNSSNALVSKYFSSGGVSPTETSSDISNPNIGI